MNGVNINLKKEFKYDNFTNFTWVQFAGTEKVCVDLCNELSKEHTVYLLTNEKIKSYINDDVNFVNLDFEKIDTIHFFYIKLKKL